MWKRTTLFILSLALFPFFLKAQPEIEVEEAEAEFDGDDRPAIRVMVHGETQDEVEKKARKTFRGWGNLKNRNDPLYVQQAEWSDLGEHPFDFYLKVVEEDDSTQEVLVGAYLGGAWLNSSDHSDRFEALGERVREFAVRVTEEAMEKLVEKEEEKLEEIQDRNEEITGNIEDLQDDVEDLQSDIEDYKKEIEKAEKDIEKNKEKMEELKEKQSEQKEVLESQKSRLERVQEKKDAVD